MIAAVFLEVNGYELTATEESLVENTLRLAAERLKEKDYAAWLKDKQPVPELGREQMMVEFGQSMVGRNIAT